MPFKKEPVLGLFDDEGQACVIPPTTISSLTDADLLSTILGCDDDTEPLKMHSTACELLLNSSHRLRQLGRYGETDLVKMGLSHYQARKIKAVFELAKRIDMETGLVKEVVNNSAIASSIFRSWIRDIHYEEFWIMLLNQGNHVITCKQVSSGGISGTTVDPRKVFKIALDHYATSLILGHNHPSGRAEPSEHDKRLTKKLANGGQMLDITILDHIILGDGTYYSFSEHGDL